VASAQLRRPPRNGTIDCQHRRANRIEELVHCRFGAPLQWAHHHLGVHAGAHDQMGTGGQPGPPGRLDRWGQNALTPVGVACRRMKGKLIIELDRINEQSDTGSGMPDLGHDIYFVKKEILNLEWTDSDGRKHKLGDKYTVGTLRIESA
jgi:hypothetical protein